MIPIFIAKIMKAGVTIAGRVVYSFLTTEGGVLGRKFNKGGEIQ